MRLPGGELHLVCARFLEDTAFFMLGSVSSESRCCAVPLRLSHWQRNCAQTTLLNIRDPADAFPDNSARAAEKVAVHRQRLHKAGLIFSEIPMELLATEDDLLTTVGRVCGNAGADTAVIDVTSLPKRYFCIMLKRVMNSTAIKNLIVTYTQPGSRGYADRHLAEDPMTCEPLPGYAAPLSPQGGALVVAVGFEPLSIRSLLEVYKEERQAIKAIMSFPPGGGPMGREWVTLREITLGNAAALDRQNIAVISAWDAEMVYKTLALWHEDAGGLTLAPYGTKPHTLGMALFAMEKDAGMYYTQPKSYNPDYSLGQGVSWAYVAKWQGVKCFERPSRHS